MRILLSGGGSGGHVFPLVALARALQNQTLPASESMEVYFVGPAHFPLDSLVAQKVKVFHISAGKARRYASISNIFSPFFAFWGFLKALWILWRVMPDAIFIKGGYGSVAVGVVAWLYRIPTLLHESDAVPGLANRILAGLATRIAIAFEEAALLLPKSKTAVIGIPVREGILAPPAEAPKFPDPKPVLLFLGGSQGAARLNATVAQILTQALPLYNIIHQCGPKNLTAFKNELTRVFKIDPDKTPGYRLVDQFSENDLGAALKAADLVISRAGASSIFEISAARKPAILIPIHDSAQDHQSRNAFDYSRAGAAEVIEETNLTPRLLLNEINVLINDPPRRTAMVQGARQFFKPNASQILAQEVIKLVTVRLGGLQSRGEIKLA